MAQASRKKSKSKPGGSHPSGQHMREAVMILSIAVSLFLLLALVTFHRVDPSWSHVSDSANILNAGGKVGAWISDVLLYMFGYLAYIFPFMLSYMGLLIYRQKKVNIPNRFIVLKIIGFIAVVLTGCALTSLYIPMSDHLPFSSGGVVGDLLSVDSVNVLNEAGASLILSAFLLTSVTLFSGFSWLKVVDGTGQLVLNSASLIVEKLKLISFKRVKSSLPAKRIKPQIIKPVILDSQKIAEKVQEKTASKSPRPEPVFKPVDQKEKPNLGLLDLPDTTKKGGFSREQLEALSADVEARLLEFNIEANVVAVLPGPVVTRFELDLAAGTKVSKISALAKDLARALSVSSVRIVEVIPGKSVIGLEVPNYNREIVRLREVLASKQYEQAHSYLSLALGKDISGHPVVVDLAKMPHLLVAGTTGSGKSVGVNAMLLSLLYKATPEHLRLILIDPKMLELSVYNDIPHLLTPVVTDMKDAANALRWCVGEMERRYRLMASLGVRNIAGYNTKIREAMKEGAPLLDPLWKAETSMMDTAPELEVLPAIVVTIDEFADMMMIVGKKVEELIARIAQKARAAGIHLILATQRPSVDVITGLIKANIPTRIAFQVSSKIDSRTILDQAGAEQLLGHGDMLYLPPGSGVPVRVHGAFVDDDEVHRVVKQLKKEGKPEYLDEVVEGGSSASGGDDGDAEKDELYDQAVQIVIETRRASISNVQRRLRIGYNRAARIVEAMEAAGLVSEMDGSGAREVLVTEQE